MTNSRASNMMLKLDHHIATGTEATYTYDPSPDLDMRNRYREIIVIMTGKATAALDLQMKLNALTDYNTFHVKGDTTTVSCAITDAAAVIQMVESTIIDGAVSFNCKASITFNDTTDQMFVQAYGSNPSEGSMQSTTECIGATTTIATIEILAPASTWIAGTEITIYGILR